MLGTIPCESCRVRSICKHTDAAAQLHRMLSNASYVPAPTDKLNEHSSPGMMPLKVDKHFTVNICCQHVLWHAWNEDD